MLLKIVKTVNFLQNIAIACILTMPPKSGKQRPDSIYGIVEIRYRWRGGDLGGNWAIGGVLLK